jgi:hypothetical protein
MYMNPFTELESYSMQLVQNFRIDNIVCLTIYIIQHPHVVQVCLLKNRESLLCLMLGI